MSEIYWWWFHYITIVIYAKWCQFILNGLHLPMIHNLSQIYIEVLHGGGQLDRNLGGVESWKHKVVHYTGNGTFQDITGVGFRSQVVIVKKNGGTAAQSGAAKLLWWS